LIRGQLLFAGSTACIFAAGGILTEQADGCRDLLNGVQEAEGSTPLISTKQDGKSDLAEALKTLCFQGFLFAICADLV